MIFIYYFFTVITSIFSLNKARYLKMTPSTRLIFFFHDMMISLEQMLPVDTPTSCLTVVRTDLRSVQPPQTSQVKVTCLISQHNMQYCRHLSSTHSSRWASAASARSHCRRFLFRVRKRLPVVSATAAGRSDVLGWWWLNCWSSSGSDSGSDGSV